MKIQCMIKKSGEELSYLLSLLHNKATLSYCHHMSSNHWSHCYHSHLAEILIVLLLCLVNVPNEKNHCRAQFCNLLTHKSGMLHCFLKNSRCPMWPQGAFYAVPPTMLNSLAPGRCESHFKAMISISLYRIVAWALALKLLLGECHRTLLMRSQHWFT